MNLKPVNGCYMFSRTQKELIVTALLGLIVTVTLVALAWNNVKERENKVFEFESGLIKEAVLESVNASDAVAHGIQALFHSSQHVDADQFRVFSKEIFSRYSFIQSATYYPRVYHQERQDFVDEQRGWGYIAYEIFEYEEKQRKKTAAKRNIYFPILYKQPLSPKVASLLGYDVLSRPDFNQSIQKAIETGVPAPSTPFELKPGSTGYEIFIAVYEGKSLPGTTDERKKMVNGLISFTINPESMFGKDAFSQHISLELDILSSKEGVGSRLFQYSPNAQPNALEDANKFIIAELSLKYPIHISEQQFQLSISKKLHLHDINIWSVILALVLGIAFWVGLFLIVMGRTNLRVKNKSLEKAYNEVEIRVHERTAELSTTNQQLNKAKEEAYASSKAKGEFLANMSHEIRTPMNAIIGLSHLALQDDMSDKQHKYLSKIQSSANSLLGIINDILDFSKIDAGKLQFEITDFYMDDVMENLSNLISHRAEEKGVEFLFDIDTQVPRFLIGDQLRLGQVLINLVNNAVKFTHEGEILISVKIEKIENGNVTLKFSVKDTGIGLTKEETAKLFQAFSQADGSTTRKYGGTGLGLTISKKLVEMMGGRIGVESTQGKGSTFFFTAVFGRKEDEKKKEILLPPIDLTGLKALVVDDSVVSLDILKKALTSFSFEVDTVTSGYEALEKVEKASKDKPYRLVLMDLRMPGMDGIETAKQIKTNHDLTDVPKVFMVTAHGREEVMNNAKGAELDGFLIKPVTRSVLFDTIMEAFGHETSGKERVSQNGCTQVKELKKIQGAKILLVEDNEINRDVALGLLEKEGFWVTVVGNGEKAVNMVTDPRLQMSEMPFDVVLMDLQMPVMDGYEATRRVRKWEDERLKATSGNDSEVQNSKSKIPIIAMTADAMSGVRKNVMEAGMDDYVTKPIDPAKLFSVLIKWIQPGKREMYVQEEPDESLRTEEPLPKFEVIDTAAGIARIGGSQASYKKLLKKFHQNNLNTIDEIQSALDNNDIDPAIRLAHSLKGVSANIGANDLFKLAGELETALKQQNGELSSELYKELLENVKQSLKQVFSAIESLETKQPESPAIVDTVESEKPIDNSKIAPIIEKLKGLLEDDDSEATRCLSSLKEELKGSNFQVELDKMERLIGGYDFEGALELLGKISQR